MKEEFNEIIDSVVKPILKEAGFKKQALTFRKSKGELIFVINFQNSRGNYYNETGFYVNCAIYSNHIAQVLGDNAMDKPFEADCQFRNRIEDISNNAASKFIINPQTDLKAFKLKLEASLKDVLQFFNSNFHDTDSVIAKITNGDGFFDAFNIFRFCLRTNKIDFAQIIIKNAKTKMLNTNQGRRWEKDWRTAFLEIIEEEKFEPSFKELDFEQRTALDAKETETLVFYEKNGLSGIEAKNFEYAIQQFELCLHIIPQPQNVFRESARIYTQLGYCHVLNKNYTKAKKTLEIAKKCLDPDIEKIDELIKNINAFTQII
jgi:tetratricopeptide (TPR) repeat protein